MSQREVSIDTCKNCDKSVACVRAERSPFAPLPLLGDVGANHHFILVLQFNKHHIDDHISKKLHL